MENKGPLRRGYSDMRSQVSYPREMANGGKQGAQTKVKRRKRDEGKQKVCKLGIGNVRHDGVRTTVRMGKYCLNKCGGYILGRTGGIKKKKWNRQQSEGIWDKRIEV